MKILAIDPGPTKCGLTQLETTATPRDLVGVHNSKLLDAQVVDTDWVLNLAPGGFGEYLLKHQPDEFLVEMIGFQGHQRSPGATTFWTLEVIGRLAEIWRRRHRDQDWDIAMFSEERIRHLFRTRIRAHVAGPKANDSKVCQALAERFGCGSAREAKGTKASPGPLYGIKSHAWQALAVAVAWVEGVPVEVPPWEQDKT